MKIATTTCDFKGYFPSLDACRILPLLADSGFKHIDLNLWDAFSQDSPLLSPDWQNWTDDVKATAERLSLDFVQAHASDGAWPDSPEYSARLELLKRELVICRQLGIPGMVVHAITRANGSRNEFMTVNASFYRELMPMAEQTGVMVYTENTCTKNCPTYFLLNGNDVNELCSLVDNPRHFGCCWDVGHAHIQGVNHRQCIQDLGNNLRAVHIHDNMGDYDRHLQPFTAGNLPFDEIIQGLLDINFKGCFTLEAFSLPLPSTTCNRQGTKLAMLPISFKIRSERLMRDITQFMLEQYNCYED